MLSKQPLIAGLSFVGAKVLIFTGYYRQMNAHGNTSKPSNVQELLVLLGWAADFPFWIIYCGVCDNLVDNLGDEEHHLLVNRFFRWLRPNGATDAHCRCLC